MFVILESLILGFRGLTYSSLVASEAEDEKIDLISMIISVLLGVSFAVGIFFILPLFVSTPLEKYIDSNVVINLVEALIRLLFVLGYIFLISKFLKIGQLFMYHGAEHMAVWAHEDGNQLNKESLFNYTKEHPRCGTSFILIVVMVSIVVFMFFPRENIILFIFSRILLVPVIAGISYELLKFGSKSKFKIFKTLLNGPGILIQKITTRNPDDDQIEVAIDSMKYAIQLNEG